MFRWLALTFAIVALSNSAHAGDRETYLLHCGGCHLDSGLGMPPEVPGLRDDLGRIANFPAGRAYLAQVPGAAQSPTTDAELAAILNWILRAYNSNTLRADFQPLTAEEVGRARQTILPDPLRQRAKIWAQYVEPQSR